MLKFIKDFDADTDISFKLPEGNYAGLFIESPDVEVLSGATASLELDLRLNGRVIENIPLRIFDDFVNIFRGKPRFDTTTGSPNDTIDVGIVIPFEYPQIPNALDIDSKDNFSAEYRHGNTLAGTLSVYAIESPNIPENFIPSYNQYTLTQDGRTKFDISVDNILGILISARDNADMVTVYKDKIVEANAYQSELIKLTEIFSRIETGTLCVSYIDLAKSKDISELLTDNVEVEIMHGASGTSSIYTISLEFNASRMEVSAGKQELKAEAKILKHLQKKPELAPVLAPVLAEAKGESANAPITQIPNTPGMTMLDGG